MGVAFMGKLPVVIQDTPQLAFVHLDIVIAKYLYQIPFAEGQFLYIQDLTRRYGLSLIFCSGSSFVRILISASASDLRFCRTLSL